MRKIGTNETISVEEVFSLLMKRKSTETRFRLPYTKEQVFAMLTAAYKTEVCSRERQFKASNQLLTHINNIAEWLTSNSPKFGLFLCGGTGNGKTTMVKALRTLICYLWDDGSYNMYAEQNHGFCMVSAKELVTLAKAYNNPTRENVEQVCRYRHIRDVEILAIDDLGQEPRESMHFGDYVTAAIDIICHRYEQRLCTIVTSNLPASEIGKYYDERIADRFREMMQIVIFGNDNSYRNEQ